MSVFENLQKKAEEVQEERRLKALNEEERRARYDNRRRAVRIQWLYDTLREIGIEQMDIKIKQEVNGLETWAVLNGFKFTFVPYRNYHELLVANPRAGRLDPDKLEYQEQTLQQTAFTLEIENLSLPDEYREKRPDMTQAYAAHMIPVQVMIGRDWRKVAEDVMDAIDRLGQEAIEAPARKRHIDAEYTEHKQRKEAERAAEKLANEAKHLEWEAQSKERAKANEEYRIQEERARAEIALKFDLNPEVFEYLIEALTDELNRRGQRGDYDY